MKCYFCIKSLLINPMYVCMYVCMVRFHVKMAEPFLMNFSLEIDETLEMKIGNFFFRGTFMTRYGSRGGIDGC